MLKGISSMATRQVLAELAAAWQARGGEPVAIESVGGVDAARRVQDGEAFDLVFLASDAIARLQAAGRGRGMQHLACVGAWLQAMLQLRLAASCGRLRVVAVRLPPTRLLFVPLAPPNHSRCCAVSRCAICQS